MTKRLLILIMLLCIIAFSAGISQAATAGNSDLEAWELIVLKHTMSDKETDLVFAHEVKTDNNINFRTEFEELGVYHQFTDWLNMGGAYRIYQQFWDIYSPDKTNSLAPKGYYGYVSTPHIDFLLSTTISGIKLSNNFRFMYNSWDSTTNKSLYEYRDAVKIAYPIKLDDIRTLTPSVKAEPYIDLANRGLYQMPITIALDYKCDDLKWFQPGIFFVNESRDMDNPRDMDNLEHPSKNYNVIGFNLVLTIQ